MKKYRGIILLVLVMTSGFHSLSWAEGDDSVQVKIEDPFINLHTGPGAAYPIFYVIDRGEQVSIEKRRTDWFRIRSKDGKVGWASRNEMQLTLLPDGENFNVPDAEADDFIRRSWAYGVNGGEFEKAPIVSVFAAYSFTENLAAELSYGESSASFSSSSLIKANLLMQPFPDSTVSPFFTLGVGNIKVKSGATLISANRLENTLIQVGFGLHYYLSRRFVLRFELNEYVILSANNSKDDNEEIGEWKTGFSIFF